MVVAVTPVRSPAACWVPPVLELLVVQAEAAKSAAAVAIRRPRRAKRCIEHRPFLVWLRVALELRDGGACRAVPSFLRGCASCCPAGWCAGYPEARCWNGRLAQVMIRLMKPWMPPGANRITTI